MAEAEVKEELEVLMSIFQDDVKHSVSKDFTEIFFFDNTQLQMKITIDDCYPNSLPKLEVFAKDSTAIVKELQKIAIENCGNPMLFDLITAFKEFVPVNITNSGAPEKICGFFLKGKCKFGVKCFNRHPGESNKPATNDDLKLEIPTKSLQLEDGEKKRSMKTAIDVINRILWDEALPTEHFIVGYLDRFVGVQEKFFTSFSWEDIASVDDHIVLAIPKHRIQYFKYRTAVVWDKTKRIDNVFGSTANTVESLTEIVANEDAKSVANETMQALNNEESNEKKYSDKDRPNAFLCLPISNCYIKGKVKEVQDYILTCDDRLKEAFIDLDALHLTLCMFRISNMTDNEKAGSVLQSLQSIMVCMLASLELRVEGVSDFRGQVIYANVQPNATFTGFVEMASRALKDAGICLLGNHDIYQPHITVAKLSRPLCKRLNLFNVNKAYYGGCQHTPFGQQSVKELRICSTGPERGDDRFYVTKFAVRNSLLEICPELPSFIADHIQRLLSAGLLLEELADNFLSELLSSKAERFDEVVSEIEKCDSLLQLPAVKRVFVLRGLPGSGKSFAAEKIAKVLTCSVCSADDYFTANDNNYAFSGAEISAAHKRCRQQFLAAIGRDEEAIVVDNTHTKTWEYAFYRRVGLLCGYQTFVLEIPCANETTRKLYSSRCKHAVSSNVHAEMWARWEVDHEALALDVENVESSFQQVQLECVNASDILYVALYLTESSKAIISKLYPFSHDNVHCDHVTLLYHPTADDLKDFAVGQEHRVKIVGYVANEKVQAVAVEFVEYLACDNDVPHVTLSTAEGVSPKLSALLLSDRRSWQRPREDVFLHGVIGLQVAINETDSRKCFNPNVRIGHTSRDENVVEFSENVSLYVGPAFVRSLFIFDFDGTLFHTPDPGSGRKRYWAVTGQRWPYRSWLGRPESLFYPLLVQPGPTLRHYHDHRYQACAMSVLLTGRQERVRSGVDGVLRTHELTFARVAMKPEDDGDRYKQSATTHFKRKYVKGLLEEYASVVELWFWDDREDNLRAINSLRRRFPRVNFHVLNVNEVKPAFYKLTPEEHMTRLGVRPSPKYRTAVEEGLKILSETWRDVIGAEVYHENHVRVFGSYWLHRRGDVDVCLFAPRNLTFRYCIDSLVTSLLKIGVKFVYSAADIRCPRLRFKLQFIDAPEVEFDVNFALVLEKNADKRPVDAFTLLKRCGDKQSEMALEGVLFFSEVVQPSLFRMSVKDFGLLVDTVCFVLRKNSLKGNCFHCVRTFHVVQLLANFNADTCHWNPLMEFESLHSFEKNVQDFFKFLSEYPRKKWLELFKGFVPDLYINPLVDFFGQSKSKSLEELLYTAPIGGQTYNVKLHVQTSDEVQEWQAMILLEAKLGGCVRNIIDSGVIVVPGVVYQNDFLFNILPLRQQSKNLLVDLKNDIEDAFSKVKINIDFL